MSAFNSHEITIYMASLDQQINILIDHKNQLNDTTTNSKSSDLIKSLHTLKKMLLDNNKKQWFDKYFLIYEGLFFEPLIQSYINLIRKEYLFLWLNQTIDQQIEMAKVNEQLYRFPNVEILNSDNFENLIKKDFLAFTRSGILAYNLTASDMYSYNAQLAVRVYRYMLTDKSENNFEIVVYPLKDLIKIKSKGDSFNYCAAYLKTLLELICKQQQRAK